MESLSQVEVQSIGSPIFVSHFCETTDRCLYPTTITSDELFMQAHIIALGYYLLSLHLKISLFLSIKHSGIA
jgi:hypothetical protein